MSAMFKLVINQQTKLGCFVIKLSFAIKQIFLVLFAIFQKLVYQNYKITSFFKTKINQQKTWERDVAKNIVYWMNYIPLSNIVKLIWSRRTAEFMVLFYNYPYPFPAAGLPTKTVKTTHNSTI